MTSVEAFTRMLDLLAAEKNRPDSVIEHIRLVPAVSEGSAGTESAPAGGDPADHPPAWNPIPPAGGAACVLCGCIVHPRFWAEHVTHCPATVPTCCKHTP